MQSLRNIQAAFLDHRIGNLTANRLVFRPQSYAGKAGVPRRHERNAVAVRSVQRKACKASALPPVIRNFFAQRNFPRVRSHCSITSVFIHSGLGAIPLVAVQHAQAILARLRAGYFIALAGIRIVKRLRQSLAAFQLQIHGRRQWSRRGQQRRGGRERRL